MAWREAVGTTLLTVALFSCAGDDSNPDGTLRNAADIETEQNAANADTAQLGDTFEVDRVSTTVDSITVVEEPDSDDRPFFVIHVRAENSSADDRMTPDV